MLFLTFDVGLSAGFGNQDGWALFFRDRLLAIHADGFFALSLFPHRRTPVLGLNSRGLRNTLQQIVRLVSDGVDTVSRLAHRRWFPPFKSREGWGKLAPQDDIAESMPLSIASR